MVLTGEYRNKVGSSIQMRSEAHIVSRMGILVEKQAARVEG